jgi:hypothetical protein
MLPTRLSLKPGEWYLAVTCAYCCELIPMVRDLNHGQSKLSGSYIVTCPKCKQPGAFEARHYQHQERRRAVRA